MHRPHPKRIVLPTEARNLLFAASADFPRRGLALSLLEFLGAAETVARGLVVGVQP